KEIESLVEENVCISKNEWDSNETSWDFKKHPFLRENSLNNQLIEKVHSEWKKESHENFITLKQNEEKLNLIFIKLYGLEGELTPEVDERDVTIKVADKTRDVKSFISYAVGCMLGRYSLDNEGLVNSGEELDSNAYKLFEADKDNIIPILSGAYFEDDIVNRFIDFVKVTFGETYLIENLYFIAESIGQKKNETSKETIRRYFLNNFFK